MLHLDASRDLGRPKGTWGDPRDLRNLGGPKGHWDLLGPKEINQYPTQLIY